MTCIASCMTETKETKYYLPGEVDIFASLKYTETLVSLDGFFACGVTCKQDRSHSRNNLEVAARKCFGVVISLTTFMAVPHSCFILFDPPLIRLYIACKYWLQILELLGMITKFQQLQLQCVVLEGYNYEGYQRIWSSFTFVRPSS